jgi:phosphopantetheinyl transferase
MSSASSAIETSLGLRMRTSRQSSANGSRRRRSPNGPRGFTEIWTLKEAWPKATGVGLTVRLDAFAFSFESSSLVFHPPSGVRADEWRFALLEPSEGFRLAVALRWNGATAMGMAVEDDANGHQHTLRRELA